MRTKELRGEVWENMDPRVLQSIAKANGEAVDGAVGGDSYSLRAEAYVQKYFREKIHVAYALNGTGANMLAMKAMLDRYSSIICSDETHINVYEAGAFEYTLGCKILPVKSDDGKLSAEQLKEALENADGKYFPKVAVITQPTERGTLYTVEELKKLCAYAHSQGMYVYIDGARLGNALEALHTDLTEMIAETDVDAFSIGGTKSGAMFGEMVVFRREEFARHLPYLQKQSCQHFDRSKFLGVQFTCLLEEGIWLENAAKGNGRARLLAEKALEKGIKSCYPVETNMVFLPVAEEQFCRISEVYDIPYWDKDRSMMRFVATANTDENEIQKLIDLL